MIQPPLFLHKIIGTAVLLSLAASLQAAVIVDLPATGFTSSGAFQGIPLATTYTTLGGMAGTNANLLSPSSTAKATSEVFYGAFVGSFNGSSSIYYPSVNLQTANMVEIRSRGSNIGGAGFPGGSTPPAGGFAGFLMWKSSDFLVSGATTFDSDSRITLTLNAATSTQGRYLINIGTQYYVSNTVLSTPGSVNSGDLTALTWREYHPETALYFDTASPIANILTDGEIRNITGVGFYIQTTTGAGANAFRFNNVEITAAVPEPSVLGLLMVSVGSAAILRRRRVRA